MLLEDYRISEKTLRSDVQSISSFIQLPTGSPIVRVTGDNLVLSDETDTSAVGEMLDAMDLYEYRLSLEERTAFIIVELIRNAGEPCSMQSLATTMYVARNTVISDSKAVENILESQGVVLIAQGKYGLSLNLTPEQENSLLIEIFSNLIQGRRHRHDFFSRFIANRLGLRSTVDDVLSHMRSYQRDHSTIMTHEAESEIAACLLVMLNWRRRGQSHKNPQPTTPQTLDFVGNMIEFVARELSISPLPSHTRIAEIEQTIFSRNLLPQIRSMSDFDLYCALSHFLLLVGTDLGIDIQNDEVLIESLLSHVKSMIDWSSDAFELAISDSPGMMMKMVEAAAETHFHVLERYLHRSLTSSMRASISIHICAALYRSEDASQPCSVVITCPGSMATSKYLEAQIKSHFHFNVIGTMAVANIDEEKLEREGIDFIISTVPIRNLDIPVITVAPVLTVEDINKIQAIVFQQRKVGEPSLAHQSILMSRLQSVLDSGNDRKIAYLSRELKRLLDGLSQWESQTQYDSPLIAMLEKRYISISPDPLMWRDAVELASSRQLEDGNFSRSYIKKSMMNIEEYGSYILVTDGVALAHAGKQDGAYQDSLGLLVAPQGITFEDGGTARLMFFFSQSSDKDYLGLFKEIIRLGNDRRGLDRLLSSQTPEEVKQIMVEVLTRYPQEDE